MKNKLTLPLVALGLSLAPILIIPLCVELEIRLTSLLLILLLLSPVLGLIAGVSMLTRGKFDTPGRFIAIGAVAVPLAFVAIVAVFFAGAMTGVISLM